MSFIYKHLISSWILFINYFTIKIYYKYFS